MSHTFRQVDLETLFLLPPSLDSYEDRKVSTHTAEANPNRKRTSYVKKL